MLAAILLWAVQAPAADPLVGLYATDQMETAAALELQQGGRFRYVLDYGAVSEEGEGDWTFDGKSVRLNSNPMPPALRAPELGNARFENQRLIVEDGDLVLERYDTLFRFRRVER
jgi:hypothetical protein